MDKTIILIDKDELKRRLSSVSEMFASIKVPTSDEMNANLIQWIRKSKLEDKKRNTLN